MSLQAISAGANALAQVYGFESATSFIASHVETLNQSENVLANRCGAILEAVQLGFGTGSESSLILIGLGRTLLGGSVGPVVTGATLTNPVTLTCAAIGAVHYGWNALSESERAAILQTVGNVFNVGLELVRSIAGFALQTIRVLMSKENLAELKRIVATGAAAFGQRLGDVTRALSDRSRDAYTGATERVGTIAAMLPTISLPFRRS